jgi:hypothetical protein
LVFRWDRDHVKPIYALPVIGHANKGAVMDLENRMADDSQWDDEQGLQSTPADYAPREYDDQEWCDMMGGMIYDH